MTKTTFNRKKILKTIWQTLIATLLLMFFLFPLYWILISSLKSNIEISADPPTLYPHEFIWENWKKAKDSLNLGRTFMNSIIVSTSTTALVLIFSTMAGFVFSKKRFPGSKIMLGIIVSTMLVPPIVLLLPLYYTIDTFGLTNSLLGIILPFGVTAFGVFFMKKYIDDVPDEVIESAEMDGASDLRVFFGIILPMVTPALASLFIITFVGNWNSFIVPYLVIGSNAETHTIPVALYDLTKGTDILDLPVILAAGAITIIPIIFVFILTQRWFIAGIMGGAVKG